MRKGFACKAVRHHTYFIPSSGKQYINPKIFLILIKLILTYTSPSRIEKKNWDAREKVLQGNPGPHIFYILSS